MDKVLKFSHLGRVVANLLQVVADLLDNLVIPLLVILGLGGVHLVQGHNHLLDAQGEGEQGVLTGLAVLRDTSLETTRGGVDDEHATVSLRGSCDHVLDEVAVTWGVDDGDGVLGGLELPQSDIDGDTALTLGLQLVQHLQQRGKNPQGKTGRSGGKHGLKAVQEATDALET